MYKSKMITLIYQLQRRCILQDFLRQKSLQQKKAKKRQREVTGNHSKRISPAVGLIHLIGTIGAKGETGVSGELQ